MIYEKMLQPKYKAETEYHVQLYSDSSVSKDFYNLLWPHFVDFLPSMHFGNSYRVQEFLADSDLLDFLGEEGIKAAEKCLLHIAHADLLPINFDGDDGGNAYFTNN
jgi:hypothetical protein